MSWSTSELAELSGTTVNTIRHYHRAGLLDEPERRSNGYKQYGTRHLARVIQIRRLRELGVPLAEVDSLGTGGGDPGDALRVIDAEMAAGIERLQRARAELAAMLRDRADLEVPAGFSSVGDRLSDADRAIITIYTQFYDDQALDDIRRMVEVEPNDIEVDYGALRPDASEGERRELAERMAPLLAQHLQDYPWLKDRKPHLSAKPGTVDETLNQALPDLYNAAQLDVLRRSIERIHTSADQAAGNETAE